ncbi:DUF1444 family protein [Prolixibacteraceae bacterium]|nr:DUF1444 family protein [Prolixibacteraceae bacterium]
MKLFDILLRPFKSKENSAENDMLSHIEFTKRYLTLLIQKHPEAEYHLENELTIVMTYQGNEGKHFLANAYNEYCSTPEDITEIIDRHVNSSSELYLDDKTIDIDKIVPMIKSNEYLEEIKKAANNSDIDNHLVYQHYNDDLIIVFGEDVGNSIRYFSKNEFEILNIPIEKLFDLSINNLVEMLPELTIKKGKGIYMITVGGEYETSLILIKHLWTKENFDIDGDIVIGIPNRDLLIVTGSNQSEDVEKITSLTQESHNNQSYQVSPHLFIFKENRFERFI